MEYFSFYSSTTGIDRTLVRVGILNGNVKWILWRGYNHEMTFANYAIIFDGIGNHKCLVVEGDENFDLELSNCDGNVYGVIVTGGSFVRKNGEVCFMKFVDVRDVLSVLLPGVIMFLDERPYFQMR